MCNQECERLIPCCLCQWNHNSYKCDKYECPEKKTANNCDEIMAEELLLAKEENSHEPPELPYEYM